MPIHFPGFGHKDHDKGDGASSPPPPPGPLPHRQSTQSSTSTSSSNAPSSILKRPSQPVPVTSSDYASSSTRESPSASASGGTSLDGLTRKVHKGLSMSSRSETSDSRTTLTSTNSNTTPPTSPSSRSRESILDGESNCPLPRSGPGHRFPFFNMTLSSTGTIQFIALPVALRPAVIESIERAWKSGKGISKITEVEYTNEAVKKARGEGKCDGGIWEVTMKDTPWAPTSQDKVSSRRILINLLTTFAAEGYNLVSSYRTSAKDSSKDTLAFLQGEPDPDPIFMAVAFHSSDRIWIIDAEADVGEAVEDGIRKFWEAGIKDARVRERHCRELRLKGNPWTSHKATSLISSRIIHLAILKHITHMDRGYDFVGSVNMSDAEEGEMPVTFYRRRWGSQRAVWTMAEN